MKVEEFKEYYCEHYYNDSNITLCNVTGHQRPELFPTVTMVSELIFYVALALGVAGNVPSIFVWLRIRFATENSSAIYLAALAINDLICLVFKSLYIGVSVHGVRCANDWLCYCVQYIMMSASVLESLLVLGFSTDRLISISHPFEV